MKRNNNQVKPLGRQLVTHHSPGSQAAEQFRTLRTNLSFATVDDDLRSVLVTSSVPEEGKSTTVANLAVVFAKQGKRVLLIDADLRKPTAHLTFLCDSMIGLTNMLTQQMPLAKAVQDTYVEGLSLLASGPLPPNPAELLASQQMKRVLEEAVGAYDIVFFDSPPVLPVTDAQILASLTDGVLLVLKSASIEKQKAKKSQDLLKQTGTPILGLVLNEKKQKKSDMYDYRAQGAL
ncbi:CpsD/CapB family tyrosine-protein kinase [Aureibacillus halotolerans]|uniref:non-specific protein-tyrosine kinase n=1 Tax=Aureibacillus halotolerans TaxID=1508390 RepID=A0A4R6TXS0_9BACI|nr:CpsD/CapB family tyrosine-protein kinase [Aureibacillus halotolerans]TDQ38688.1 capsular exopolysaccharide synthesis family protein [Aureibacillus halotolerans]